MACYNINPASVAAFCVVWGIKHEKFSVLYYVRYEMAMMKNKAWVCLAAMAVWVVVFSAGCSAPGLTKSEVHRRHHHTVLNNWWQVQDDIDTVLLLDRPTRLSSMPVR